MATMKIRYHSSEIITGELSYQLVYGGRNSKATALLPINGEWSVNIDSAVAVGRSESHCGRPTVSVFMRSVIADLERMGKYRTSETYDAALKSFLTFRGGEDILLEDMDSDIMLMYEKWLLRKGLVKNSISFYMRILRAVYNRAVEKELIVQRNPFRHVYTGVDKTSKRAISLTAIRQIKNMPLSMEPHMDFARDMFLFSFYTRGMSFIDMAYLKKTDLQNGTLIYSRRKTGQMLRVKWEKCMQIIVDKYIVKDSCYLLPILDGTGINERRQYESRLRSVNDKLKGVARLAGLTTPLSTYVARHSWASIAKSKNVPISVISEGMGHDSETTTQIYLTSLENSVIDRANELIISSI